MIVLGLGSNIGDRVAHLEQAIRVLGSTVLNAVEISPIYQSPALLDSDAPMHWNQEFYNMTLVGESHLEPEELLKAIKAVEKEVGRVHRGHWAPREIDIDILAYDDLVVDRFGLQIPHKDLLVRPFAMLPFADLVPNWLYPVPGENYHKTAYELALGCQDKSDIQCIRASINLNLKRVA